MFDKGKHVSNLIPFDFNDEPNEVQEDDDGTFWWILSQCCKDLGIEDVGWAAACIDSEDKRQTRVLTRNGKSYLVWQINASGIRTLLWMSNTPKGQQFRLWLVEMESRFWKQHSRGDLGTT